MSTLKPEPGSDGTASTSALNVPYRIRLPRNYPLYSGTLLRRYKRFLADVELDNGQTLTAHCVNTGAMEGITTPGTRIWLRHSDSPTRKLAYTWELADINGEILGVDTGFPNRLVKQLIMERHLPWINQWKECRPEKKLGLNCRTDFYLQTDGGPIYLEVKNCHLVYPDNIAYFPDCVSTRASHHMEELSALLSTVENGRPVRAMVLFCVQIPTAQSIRPSDLHDPAFALAARKAAAAGVTFHALKVTHTVDSIQVDGPLPVGLAPYDTTPLQQWRQNNQSN